MSPLLRFKLRLTASRTSSTTTPGRAVDCDFFTEFADFLVGHDEDGFAVAEFGLVGDKHGAVVRAGRGRCRPVSFIGRIKRLCDLLVNGLPWSSQFLLTDLTDSIIPLCKDVRGLQQDLHLKRLKSFAQRKILQKS